MWIEVNNSSVKHLCNINNYEVYAIDDGVNIKLAKRKNGGELEIVGILLNTKIYSCMQEVMEAELKAHIPIDYFSLEYAQKYFYKLFDYAIMIGSNWEIKNKPRYALWEKAFGYKQRKHNCMNYNYTVFESEIMRGIYERCMKRIRKAIEGIYHSIRKMQYNG